MAKNNKLWIDMCAGSELKDTQGETLSVEGANISDLEAGKGRLNDNHGKGFFNSLGRVTEAKKIFKAEDCENERHKYYWEKIKAPYIYAKGYLYSDEEHSNAKAAAAILRNIHKDDAPLSMKASVEGGVISRGVSDSTRLARTKIHSVALTFTPANNATLVEPLNLDKSNANWQEDEQLIKSVMHLAHEDVPSFRHIERHASANTIQENIEKIKELAKSIGVDIEIKNSNTKDIIKNAVMHKVASNISKINDLVKALKGPSDKFQSGISKLKSDPTTPKKPLDLDNAPKNAMKVKDARKTQYINKLKSHASKAMRNDKYLDSLHGALLNSKDMHPDKAGKIIDKVKSYMAPSDVNKREDFKNNVKKALTAGYGGAGAPGSQTGGSVIQAESLESDGFKHITCEKCGQEQIHMSNQVKCRKCNKNFSLEKLQDLM